jgi:ABC-type glycerol-3-phosphate transport system substrate-binding protein
MLTSFVSKSTPDTAYLNNDMIIPWSQGHMLVPLDPYLASAEQADFPAGVMSGCRYQGKLMMIPTLIGPHTSIYNKDIFKTIGADPADPPVTWDDLYKVCALAKKKGYYGFQYTVSNQDVFDTILWGAGGHYMNPAGTKSLLDSPEAVAAVEFIVKMFDNKWVPSFGNTLQTSTTLPDYFVAKKQAVSAIYDAASCLKATQQMAGSNLGLTPVLKDKTQACFGTVGTFGIFTTTKNADVAAKWLQFLMQPENQAFYNQVGGYTPPRTAARKLWKAPPLVKQFADTAKFIRADRDTFFYYAQNITYLGPALQEAILHQKTPQQAMSEAAKSMNTYIAQVNGE